MCEASLKIDNAAFAITVDPKRCGVQDAALVIDARGYVITPAFVDAHTHISYAHAVRESVSRRLRWPAPPARRVPSADRDDGRRGIRHLIVGHHRTAEERRGTFVDPGSTKFLDACMQAYADTRCRIVTGESLLDRPDERSLPRYSTEEALARTERLIRRYDHHLDGRVRVWAMPFGTDNRG